jgi:hypothetical protein
MVDGKKSYECKDEHGKIFEEFAFYLQIRKLYQFKITGKRPNM